MSQNSPMNFIFFNPDEMRAESTAPYGHPLVETPNLDRLAEEGVRFEQCHTTNVACSPSRCSLLTGWYPHVRGHRSLWHLLTPEEPNLFKYLAEDGYEVVWYGKNDAFAPETFKGVVADRPPYSSEGERSGGKHGGNPYEEDDPRYYSFLYEEMGAYEETPDYEHVKRGIDYLLSVPEEPFMLYLPIGFPHPPYHAPQGYHEMYNPQDLPPLRAVKEGRTPDFYEEIRKGRRLDLLDEETFREINAKYLGSISYVDSLFGDLMEALEESGLAEETAVFFYSDHGDWAGDYGLVEKWWSELTDPLTRVPLVGRVPGLAEGHVVEEPVEHHDLTPTVLELAGIEAEHSFFARSLLPQFQGEAGDPERAVFCEGGYDLPHDEWCFEGRGMSDAGLSQAGHIYYPKLKLQQEKPHTVCRSTMIRTGTYKLIYRTKQINELYDLKEDPEELRNVYGDPDYAAVQEELEERMLQWYVETSDVTPWQEHPRGFVD